MSGAEVLGIIAGAAQLIDYTISITNLISDIYRRVKNAPKKIQQQFNQIRQFIDLAERIKQHPQLQVASVNDQINSALDQARSVAKVLEKVKAGYSHGSIQRYWKILRSSRDKEILESLTRLENEKTALILCIQFIHFDFSVNPQGLSEHSVPNSVSEMAPKKLFSRTEEPPLVRLASLMALQPCRAYSTF